MLFACPSRNVIGVVICSRSRRVSWRFEMSGSLRGSGSGSDCVFIRRRSCRSMFFTHFSCGILVVSCSDSR